MAKGFPDPPANWGHKDFSLSHVYPSRYCRAQPTGLTYATERNSSGAWNRSGTCPRLSMWALPRVLCFQSSLPPPLVHQIGVIHLRLPVPCRIWHACWPRPQDNPVRPIPGLTSDDLVYSLALLELKIENSIVKCDLLDFYLPALSFSGLSKGAAFPT